MNTPPNMPELEGHSEKCRGKKQGKAGEIRRAKKLQAEIEGVPTHVPRVGGCDYCDCHCHPFELCKRFKIDRSPTIKPDLVKPIGVTCRKELEYFTSAFLVLYVEQEEPGTQSKLIPGSPPVSMLFGQENRAIHGGPFFHQNSQVFLTTGMIGGRRKSWLETPVDCAIREYNEEVSVLLAEENVKLSEIRAIAEAAWNEDRLFTHVGQSSAQISMFLRISDSMMKKLVDAITSFHGSSTSGVVSAALLSEAEVLQQLAKFVQKKQQNDGMNVSNTFNGQPLVFANGDMYMFTVETLLAIQKHTDSGTVSVGEV